MRRLRLSLAGTVILALLGGLGGAVVAQDEAGKTDPAAEATVEVLSDVGVIPLEAIPENADHVTFARISTEPGVSGQVGSAQPQEWTNLAYTHAGSRRETWDTPVRIWRVDGSVVDVPAGTPLESHTGEVALFYNGGAASVFENPGADENVLFFVGVGNSLSQETRQVAPPGSEWRLLDSIFPPHVMAKRWFETPIAVDYERITWEPGAQLVLGPDEIPMLSFIWLESGKLKYGEVPLDEVAEADFASTLAAGLTWREQDPTLRATVEGLIEVPSDDTVYVLRNEGDEPAVAIGVTLSHATETEPAAIAD